MQFPRETYLYRLLVPEIYVIPNFVKTDYAVLEIYENCVHGQKDRRTDNRIFYKVQTYLDRLLVPKIYIIPSFVKIVKAVVDIYSSCVYGHTDRQPDFLQS